MAKHNKFERLAAYYAPTSQTFLKTVCEEAEAIARGETAGLDPAKQYLAVRVLRNKSTLDWIIAESPFYRKSLTRKDIRVMFVANVTLSTAIHLVNLSAQIVATQDNP